MGLSVKADELGFGQIAWRTVVVFFFGVLLSRIADRRILGRMAGYDIVILVLVAAVLSRAVTGVSPFFSTLGASALLVLLHRLMGTVAYRWHWLSVLVKGRDHVLVRDGIADRDELRRNKITDDDLIESLRLHGEVAEPKDVREARLERNGEISVITKKGRSPGE